MLRAKGMAVCLAVGLSLGGCASSIVDGEAVRTSPTGYPARNSDEPIEVAFEGQAVEQQPYLIAGKVFSRSWVFEKGIEELKRQARTLGADAVVNVEHERKFSVDYLQDLYFITGDAVVWQ